MPSWLDPLRLLHVGVSMAFARGAKATPRHKLQAAMPFRKTGAPAQFAVVPKQLSFWLNNQVGDCVTAEEAYAKAVWSIMSGLDELFIPDSEVQRWASKYGYLDGAYLTEVMDTMAKDGFSVNNQNYKDGAYQGVDYSNEPVLQAAIATGPVKIGIDADALPSDAGNMNGWYSVSTGNFSNEDHCVGLSGYGAASWLYSQLGVAVPSGLDPSTFGYLLFTWNTIGFVTHGWIMSTCQEAWVRNPTTPGQGPAPQPDPNPNPNPNPTPTPIPTPSQIGSVVIPDQKLPDQTFTFQAGFSSHTITLKGQTVKGGTYVVTTPISGLTTAAIEGLLTEAGITPASVGNLTPQQWQMIIALILQLLPILFPPTPSGSTLVRATKLTPQQWAAIIQLVLTLLPIFLGG